MIIIGLLAAMVIPRIGRGIAQRQLDRAAQQLVVDLQTANQLAGRHRRPVRFRAVGTTGYEVVDRNTPDTTYIRRNLGAGSGTNATLSSFQSLDFYPNGLTSGTASLTVTLDGRTRTVSVSRVGHVRRNW